MRIHSSLDLSGKPDVTVYRYEPGEGDTPAIVTTRQHSTSEPPLSVDVTIPVDADTIAGVRALRDALTEALDFATPRIDADTLRELGMEGTTVVVGGSVTAG